MSRGSFSGGSVIGKFAERWNRLAHHAVIGIGILRGPEDFVLDVGHGMKHELGKIGEGIGIAGRDLALRESLEDLAEDVVDVETGVEVAGKRRDLLSEFLGESLGLEMLLFFAGMEGAKRGMGGLAKHAAAASIGEGAETRVVVRLLGFHKTSIFNFGFQSGMSQTDGE